MAKKINVDEIDESFIIASVRKDRTGTGEIAPPPLTPLPATVVPQKEEEREENTPALESLPEPGKEENRRKRNKQDYETLFIRESDVTARLGKTVYLRKEYHDRILKIIQVIGNNEISLFSYMDNIIAHHFDTFQEDITRSYNRKNRNTLF